MIIKGGFIAYAQMGDPNASIPTPQPVHGRYMFGGYGRAIYSTSYTFVSKAAYERGIHEELSLQKMVAPVAHCRGLTKAAMIHNDFLPVISVDPETYEVRVNGDIITCEPAAVLPMAQRYFLF
jgi:urease subunit alpha